ncbi:MAG: alpha/beta fold hydrolase [Dehalococcoidia bacterium]|nr:alpha/beta fold hydrolase [Dehalococcoidia bacterium]
MTQPDRPLRPFRITRTPIRYARSTDGVNLAYLSAGRGRPGLILGDPLFTHLEQYWPSFDSIPGVDDAYEKVRLLYYSPRGFGLSDREVGETTIEHRITDIDAILDHAGIEKVTLLSAGAAGVTALLYAAARPERVSDMVLYMFWNTQMATSGGLAQLLEENWDLYTVLIAQITAGRMYADQGRSIAELMQASGTRDTYRAWLGENATVDVRALLPQVTVPTLVLAREQKLIGDISSIEGARRIAGSMPNASMALLPGDAYIIDEHVIRAVSEFMTEQAEPSEQAIRIILFTDFQGHLKMMQALGDDDSLPILREHERITRRLLREYGADEVKALGDGFMASFASAQRALECSVAMQLAFEEHNLTADHPIHIRIGVNAGEPIAEDDDLFGTAVIAASRIASQASGGEILTSLVVRELVAGKGFLFADRGETQLRGFEDPVRMFQLRWRDAS